MTDKKLKNEIDTLRHDANKVIADLANISETVGAAGREKSEKIAADLSRQAEAELQALREKMREVEKRSLEYASLVDVHVRQNPYVYLLSFLGFGLLLGKLLSPSRR